jgi:hypothetical protein
MTQQRRRVCVPFKASQPRINCVRANAHWHADKNCAEEGVRK